MSLDTSFASDSNNLFDEGQFIPGTDSVETLLIKIDTLLHREIARQLLVDSLLSLIKQQDNLMDPEQLRIHENILQLDSFLNHSGKPQPILCKGDSCAVFALIVKSKQLLYLYLSGELKDSFPVSTGKKKYTTASFSTRPSGPLFIKYTSRKFPGGNYKGLGNMPYAVFVKGGYAIHGTTTGNFSILGSVASHGCIRLHPDNARVFYELVRLFGLHQTWVTVRDSL